MTTTFKNLSILSVSRLDRYDYSNSYIEPKKSHPIIHNILCRECKTHFNQSYYSHKNGSGCPKCAVRRSTFDDFISKARGIHNNKYDYSLVNYIDRSTKVLLICNSCHNEFYQTPHKHLLGQGCKKCGLLKIGNRYSTSDFITKAGNKHGDLYDYSLVSYSNSNDPIKIICKTCGYIFMQDPTNHLCGCGCPECAKSKIGDAFRSNMSEFIIKANQIHNNRYDYSLASYINSTSKITIKCNKCNRLFEQSPSSHLNGSGCGCHHISLGQNEICSYLRSLGVNILINDKSTIKPYELDMLIPHSKTAIEYHGLYYHSYNTTESARQISYHLNKLDLCTANGIQLIQIFENEWHDKQDIVKSILASKLKLVQNRCFARKCHIKQLNNNAVIEFFDNNHIQGHRHANIIYGLLYNDELVQAMSFSKHAKYEWELIRLATKLNYNVVGGASKLLTEFINKNNPNYIFTYADRRFSNGCVYNTLGFKSLGYTKPNYWYTKNCKLYSRQQFQKHKLISKLNIFDSSMSEPENMFNNGYRRIWDCGHHKFLFTKFS